MKESTDQRFCNRLLCRDRFCKVHCQIAQQAILLLLPHLGHAGVVVDPELLRDLGIVLFNQRIDEERVLIVEIPFEILLGGRFKSS